MEEIPPTLKAGHAILDEIKAIIDRHVYLGESAKIALALWILYSYVWDAFWHQPRLLISSPAKRSGKSTMLKVLKLLCSNPHLTGIISSAGIYRLIEECRPTLLLDEADTYLGKDERMRGVIDNGFEKDGIVTLTDKENHKVRNYACASPLAIAGIGTFHDTIADRSIVITMERKPRTVELLRLQSHRPETYDGLRETCRIWADSHKDWLAEHEPTLPDLKSDRADDSWRPLIAIADKAGGAWSSMARAAAQELVMLTDAATQEDVEQMVLTDIQDIFEETGSHHISSKELCRLLAEKEDRPWSEWPKGRPINPFQLSQLLKPFKIKTRSIRLPGDKTPKGYVRADFEKAWASYL